ncbi:MAG: SufD family Fe-S cluster assembly protein [Armatimonadota bacterium]
MSKIENNIITNDDAERMLSVGVDTHHQQPRSGNFVHIDDKTIGAESFADGLEVMDIKSALGKHSWLEEYYWKNVSPDKDEYTKMTFEAEPAGYFIRSLPGAKVEVPVQACLYLKQVGEVQKVHNIVIAEEGSELTIITGCATSTSKQKGTHVGVSELYVKKNATLNFAMIHNWGDEVEVRPRSVTTVEENGTYINNYFCFKPVTMLQMYPTVILNGANSAATMNSVLAALPGSTLDVGSRIQLKGENSRGESISRVITTGGTVISRGHLIGEVPGIRAHLECSGLILSNDGVIKAIPELEGSCDGLEMSHEAAVGKIAEDEVLYLMTRGLTREEATSAIVRGFLRVELKGLPQNLKKQIDDLTAKVAADSL